MTEDLLKSINQLISLQLKSFGTVFQYYGKAEYDISLYDTNIKVRPMCETMGEDLIVVAIYWTSYTKIRY